jgi:hypothetical protein
VDESDNKLCETISSFRFGKLSWLMRMLRVYNFKFEAFRN